MLSFEVDVTNSNVAPISPPKAPSSSDLGSSADGAAFVDAPSQELSLQCMTLGSLIVSEKLSVLQLKQLLHQSWAALALALGPGERGGGGFPQSLRATPPTHRHLRLRDYKGLKVMHPELLEPSSRTSRTF